MHAADAELARRARDGDRLAFDAIVERYADELFRLAWSIVGNAADAEDVVQQAFMGAYLRIASFEGRSSLKTWLVSIVMNQSSKSIRSRRVRRAEPLDVHAVADDAGLGGRVGGPGSSGRTGPVNEAAIDTRADVKSMLATLSPDHREVLVLRELHQMSYDEIAAALAIPRGTVESRLFRARRELRERYGEFTS